jgi:hypothetical protein
VNDKRLSCFTGRINQNSIIIIITKNKKFCYILIKSLIRYNITNMKIFVTYIFFTDVMPRYLILVPDVSRQKYLYIFQVIKGHQERTLKLVNPNN